MFRFALVLFVASSAFGLPPVQELLFDPCKQDDLVCVMASLKKFNVKTYKGMPEYNIKQSDPYTVPVIDVINDESSGITLQYVDNVVKGFADLDYFNLEMDVSQSPVPVKYEMQVNFSVNSDIKFSLSEAEKEFTGSLVATGTAHGTAEYLMYLEEVDGVTYFKVSGIKVTSQIVGEPTVTYDGEFLNLIHADSQYKEYHHSSVVSELVYGVEPYAKMAEVGFNIAVDNLVAMAAVEPADQIFTDIQL